MKADDIRALRGSGTIEYWLAEIAYQLAIKNEHEAEQDIAGSELEHSIMVVGGQGNA